MSKVKGLLREIETASKPATSRNRFLELVQPSMDKSGWVVATESPGAIAWWKEDQPSGVMVVLMPIFSWMVDRGTLWLSAQFVETSAGTTIAISGTVPDSSQFEELLDHVQASIDD